MEWTEELIGRLRSLWEQGLPTAEIGRQLSISKNAVVGKAHRLKLPPRPSPIKNRVSTGERKPPAPRKKALKVPHELPLEGGKSGAVSKVVDKKSSTSVSSSPKEKPSNAKKQAEDLLKQSAAKVAPSPEIASSSKIEKKEVAKEHIAVMVRAYVGSSAPARKVAPVKRERDPLERSFRQGLTCQWPHGNPGEPDFHFCGGVPLAGKPYCAEHAAIAYVKIRDRRE